MTSPRNPALFSPHDALTSVLAFLGKEKAGEVASILLPDDDEHVVYTTPEMPRGFKVLVTIQPERNAIILRGLELVDGRRYNIVVRVSTYRGTPKTQTWRGWTFFEQGRRWGGYGFAKVVDHMAGPMRFPREIDVVSIEEVPDGA